MKYSELLNKKIVSIFDGKNEGIIKSFSINKNYRISNLFLDNDKILETKKIFKIGNDCLLIKNSNVFLIATLAQNNNFLGKEVFDLDGNFLGKICDINISNKFEIKSFLTNKTEFSNKQIVCNKTSIIINTKDTHFNLNHFKPSKNIINKKSTQQVMITKQIPIKAVSQNFLIKKHYTKTNL